MPRLDPARWQRLESVCFAALERPQGERASYLDEACAGDPELRREALALVAQLEADPSFLERPITDLPYLTAPDVVEEPLPTAIGPYRLIRRLGSGGMGDVCLAIHQVEDVRRSVALKVIRRGRDTEEVLRRFRLERRILAGLTHPNIARLLDAGATDDGRPYFVMEHVEGRPIDEYCDLQRLPVEGRLRLFQVVCDAVQHAHRNLVVHRDLKPTNILVDDAGVPKLLDFGIGKVLGETETFGTAVQTRADVRLLTPAHAAPEQIRGEPVTTATDVYALGVLLYQLLAGRHPYVRGGESLPEIERAVLETSPLRPSAALSDPASAAEIARRRAADPGRLRRELAGDLDNIVLRAMRREPERRYASPADLADDLRRHLAGRPVTARPDTFGYRARKFVRRNTAGVAAAAVALLALGTTMVVTLVQSRRVARESEQVARERDKALEVRGFLMEMFGATGADRAVGDSVTARRLLDLQAASVGQAYAERPELKAEMLEVLADGYDRLGLVDAAEPLAREALTLRRATLGHRHPDIASPLNLLGWILHQKGSSAEAEPLLREAVEIRRAAGPRHALDLSRSLNDLGVVLTALGSHAGAETVLDEALAIRRGSLGDGHRSVGITASNLGAVYYHQAKLDEAIRVQELAVRGLLGAVGPDHQRSIVALGNLATLRHTAGDWEGAEREYRELLRRQTRLRGPRDLQTAHVLMSLGAVIAQRATAAADHPGLAGADSLLRQALAIFEERLGTSHPSVGGTLERLASVLSERGHFGEARRVQERSLRLYRGAYGESHMTIGLALSRLARIRWRMSDTAEALRLQRQALANLEGTAGPGHPETGKSQAELCHWLLQASGEAAQAVALCQRAERTLRDAPATYRRTHALVRLRLAQAHLAAGALAVADSILADARRAVEEGTGGAAERRLLDSLVAVRAGSR